MLAQPDVQPAEVPPREGLCTRVREGVLARLHHGAIRVEGELTAA